METTQIESIRLQDGRRLTYAEYGDPHGSPLFFLHGGNDSRLVGAIIDRSAFDLGIRIIAPDRPGYGRSDFQPGRTLLDWAADLAELAAALSIGRFAIAGHSGGGPHALAVAHALPERCAGVTLIASAGPPGSSNRGNASDLSARKRAYDAFSAAQPHHSAAVGRSGDPHPGSIF